MGRWFLIVLAVVVCWPRSGKYVPHAEPCDGGEALLWAVAAYVGFWVGALMLLALV